MTYGYCYLNMPICMSLMHSLHIHAFLPERKTQPDMPPTRKRSLKTRKDIKQACLEAIDAIRPPNGRDDYSPDYYLERVYDILSVFSPTQTSLNPFQRLISPQLQEVIDDPYFYEMEQSTRRKCLKVLRVNLDDVSGDEIENIRTKMVEDLPYPAVFDFEEISTDNFLFDAPEYFTMKAREPKISSLDLERLFKLDYKCADVAQDVIRNIEDKLSVEFPIPFGSIVESSMTGKTRLIAEIAKSVPTLYLNLRCGLNFWPPPKRLLFLEELKLTAESDSHLALEMFKNFVIELVAKVSQKVEKLPANDEKLEALFNAQLSPFGWDFPSVLPSALSDDAKAALWDTFLDNTPSRRKSPLRLLIVFDGARFLLQKTNKYTYLDEPVENIPSSKLMVVVRKALMDLRSMKGLFSVMIDTTHRIVSPHELLFFSEPIHINTFDVWLDKCPLSLRISNDPKHYVRMGRPGWNDADSDGHIDKVKVATERLNHGRCCKRDASKMAALMCVFEITADTSPTLVEQLCGDRLASLVNSPSGDPEIKYFSEPVLVHGAHQILEDMPNRIFFFLRTFVYEGYIGVDHLRLIVARVLLLQRLTQLTPKDFLFEAAQTNRMTLTTFLKRINFPQAENLLDLKLRYGAVHVSHWHTVNDGLGLHSLVQSYYRGAGIICRGWTFDLLIPIFIDKKDNHDQIECMEKSAYDLMQNNLTDNERSLMKRMFSFMAIRVREYSEDLNTFVDEITEQVAQLCDQPGYIMQMQLDHDGEDDNRTAVTNGKHIYLKRSGLKKWGLSPLEEMHVKNLLDECLV